MKIEISSVATHVDGAVIADSGHWIMEEQPEQVIRIIETFLRR
jgi:pimeloyl-ACP methyl ester carboxylesterase